MPRWFDQKPFIGPAAADVRNRLVQEERNPLVRCGTVFGCPASQFEPAVEPPQQPGFAERCDELFVRRPEPIDGLQSHGRRLAPGVGQRRSKSQIQRLTGNARRSLLPVMDLPEDKGTYILIVLVAQMKRLQIGRLGTFDIHPGFYAYIGSAFGPGGLRARVGHHLESIAEPHWHIDYLLGLGQPVEVWYAISDRKLERDWVELLADAPQFQTPIPRFGSSDYRRSRTSHLFHAKRQPSFRWFEQEVRQALEPDVQPRQFILAPPAPRSD